LAAPPPAARGKTVRTWCQVHHRGKEAGWGVLSPQPAPRNLVGGPLRATQPREAEARLPPTTDNHARAPSRQGCRRRRAGGALTRIGGKGPITASSPKNVKNADRSLAAAGKPGPRRAEDGTRGSCTQNWNQGSTRSGVDRCGGVPGARQPLLPEDTWHEPARPPRATGGARSGRASGAPATATRNQG